MSGGERGGAGRVRRRRAGAGGFRRKGGEGRERKERI